MSTRAVLEHFGLHADIALAVASTLAPAEAWALGAYATGARLGPGWIATQVFAFDTRQPRTAALARRYDEAGRVLAALPPPDALQALGMVDQWCPDAPEQALAALGAAGIDPPICLAVRTLWPIVNELRRGRIPTLDPLAGGRPGGGAAPLSPDEPSEARELWQTVRAELQATIPAAEFATWLEHVTLLDVDGERAVIGAPNVFVRERVDVHYLPLITRALSNAVGRPVQAQTAIGG